jgi:Tfp pilus assembly protein PilN
MRPINLIPEQERRHDGGAGRTGPLAFIVVGALLFALAGVVALVITSNQVSERESEITSLQARTVAAKQRADRLSAFTSFDEIKEQRVQTITELADNRFDWSRVLHELALVMPRWVILTKITGSSGQIEGESGTSGIGGTIKGPALTVYGCGKSQTRVAQMVTAMKQIDGVTRVGLNKSVLRFPAESSGSSGGSEGEGEGEGECPPGLYTFEAVAAFDAAPLPVGVGEATAVAASEPESTESSESESSSGSEEASETTETTSTGTTTKTTTETIPPKS